MTTRSEVEIRQFVDGLEGMLALEPPPKPPRRGGLFRRTRRPAPSPLVAKFRRLEGEMSHLADLIADARSGCRTYPTRANAQNLEALEQQFGQMAEQFLDLVTQYFTEKARKAQSND